MDIDPYDVEYKAIDEYAYDEDVLKADGTQGYQGKWTVWGALNAPQKGTDFNQRIGRRIHMTHMSIRGSYSGFLNASDFASFLRIVVVYDSQTNGTLAVPTDIFAVDACNSPLNLNNRDRFTVLIDHITKTVTSREGMSEENLPAVNGITPFVIERTLDHLVTYNALNNGSHTDIETGCVWFCYSQAGFVNTDPTMDWYARVRYSDF